jgi:hypothetical protein
MEDKIRSLCEQILAGSDDEELTRLIVELRKALHQYVQQLRAKLADYPAAVERRKHFSSELGLHVAEGSTPASAEIGGKKRLGERDNPVVCTIPYTEPIPLRCTPTWASISEGIVMDLPTPQVMCAICNQPLTLLADDTCSDDKSKPVHRGCYAKQIAS